MRACALLAILALGQADPDLDGWLRAFRAGDVQVEAQLVAAGKRAVPGLVLILKDAKLSGVTRFQAANVLGDIGEKECVEPLLAALADPYYNIRRCAAVAVAKCHDERARKPLEKLASEDPFEFTDAKTGEKSFLVRESAREALAILDGKDPTGAGLAKEPEIFLDDASKMPPSPVKRPLARVGWPFPGDLAAQNLFNNYDQPTDDYVHGGLDLMHDAGTEVHAVADGVVVMIDTNYKEWKTHTVVIVGADKDAREGWSYTHMDPDTFTFRLGDRVEQGQLLGKLVDFKLGDKDGADHLHLGFDRFEKKADGTIDLLPQFDPLLCLAHEDELAPLVHEIDFLKAGTTKEIGRDARGATVLAGRVDVLALVSDCAFEGQACNWGVPVMTLEIRGKGAAPWRKLVLDLRAGIGEFRAARALFLPYAAKQPFVADLPPYPVVQAVIATHTDGDGLPERADALQCWDTGTLDAQGRPRFPNGEYEVVVRAWDLAGKLGQRTEKVRVKNGS